MKSAIDYKPEYVGLDDVPMRLNGRRTSIWRERFNAIPDGKAVMLNYNNRQRAHQVRNNIRTCSKRFGIKISTRIIKAEPIIDGTGGWLLYYWKS